MAKHAYMELEKTNLIKLDELTRYSVNDLVVERSQWLTHMLKSKLRSFKVCRGLITVVFEMENKGHFKNCGYEDREVEKTIRRILNECLIVS